MSRPKKMMNDPKIEPIVKRGGSAFQNNYLNSTHTISHIKERDNTKYVSLTQWCQENFVSKRTGRKLIKFKYLIAVRRHHRWWVTANPDCLLELLDYLGMEKLLFDADND